MEGLLRWLLRIGKAITEGMEGDQNIVKAKEAFKQGMAARKEFEEKNNITMEPLRDPEEEDGSTNKDEEENANKEEKRAEEKKPVCNWYKRGNCRFGRSGRNREGQCYKEHPETCPLFDQMGWKRLGCQNKRCKLLHREVCNSWMAEGRCRFKENGRCRYYHPWGIKEIEKETRLEKQEKRKENYKEQGEEVPLTRKEIIVLIAETVQATLQQWRPQYMNGQAGQGQMQQCMPGPIQQQ